MKLIKSDNLLETLCVPDFIHFTFYYPLISDLFIFFSHSVDLAHVQMERQLLSVPRQKPKEHSRNGRSGYSKADTRKGEKTKQTHQTTEKHKRTPMFFHKTFLSEIK